MNVWRNNARSRKLRSGKAIFLFGGAQTVRILRRIRPAVEGVRLHTLGSRRLTAHLYRAYEATERAPLARPEKKTEIFCETP